MKKRIIATLLAVVMTVLSLVSCGAGFSFADDDLTQYTDGNFDLAKFFDALKNIEIEDGDYTTDKEINDKKVIGAIYDKIATAVITEAGKAYYSDDKLEAGDIGEGDIVYFCYYAKDAETGDYFMLKEMQESTITASATKAKHFIKLGNYDEDDEFTKKLAEALLAKKGVKYYSMQTATNLKNDDKSIKIAKDDVIVVSYDVEYKEGEGVLKKTADYETIKLNSDTALAKKLVSLIETKGAVVNYGAKVAVPTATYNGESDKTTTNTFEVVDGGITYKYSNFNIDYKVDSYVEEKDAISFTYKDTTLVDALCDSLRLTSAEKVKLKEKELTYYIYPTYRLDVPAVNAESIIEYVYGKNVSSTSNELFTDEDFKYTAEDNTEKKVEDLVSALSDLWKDKFEKDSDLAKLLEEYEKADKAVDEATSDKLDAAEEALEKAEKALYAKKREEIRATIAKIVAAKNGDEVLGEELYEHYDEDSRHTLKEEYDTYITEEVGKKVWAIIDEQIKVTSYPEKLVEQFADHLYESYEYEFYNGDYTPEGSSTSTKSNYLQYEGNLKKYLIAETGAKDESGIGDAIEAEAKEHLEPIIKVYYLAQKLNSYNFGDGKTINGVIQEYVERDIAAGVYEAHYEYNDNLTEKENERAKAKAEEQAKENKENARKNAKNFLVTDAVFDAYKKDLGKKTYQVWEEQYGEINIRASLQLDKLFYFLVSTDVVMNEDGDHAHSEVKYVEENGKLWVAFRTLDYHFTVEKDEADSDKADK